MTTHYVDEIFSQIVAEDIQTANYRAQKILKREAKIKSEKQKQEEIKNQEALDLDFVRAVNDVDFDKAEQLLKNGANLSNVIKKHGWSIFILKTAEATEYMLRKMDLNNSEIKKVAEDMIKRTFFEDIEFQDKSINMAKAYGLSLSPIMKELERKSPSNLVDAYNKLISAGVNQEDFDFASLLNKYYNKKNGYYAGREGDIWRDPKPEEAAELKQKLSTLIKSGYKLNLKTSNPQREFVRELAWENEYKNFSEQDKKMIEDLKNDTNVVELSKTIKGKIPVHIDHYMTFVVPKEQRGQIFNKYKDEIRRLEDENKSSDFNFSDFAAKWIKLDDWIKWSNSNNVDENIVDYEFCKEFEKNPDLNLAKKISLMSTKCKRMVSLSMAEKLDKELYKARFKDCDKKQTKSLMAFTMELYNCSEEDGKNALRATMLKLRTAGDNEQRRETAQLYQETLKDWRMGNIQKDETIKAVSQVSYTRFSSLNRLISKLNKNGQTL